MWICYTGCGSGDWVDFLARLGRDSDYGPLGELPPLPPKQHKPVLKSLLARGFTHDVLEKWQVEWDETVGAMQLPVYDGVGAFQGKIWRFPVGIQPKYRYQPGFERSATLYGLWRLPNKLARIVLVEGPLDAIWVQEAEIPCLAILGSSLSEQQVTLLKKICRKVILCFDNDGPGRVATKNATALLKAEGCWVYRAQLPVKCKDIQEVAHDHVGQVINRAELAINGRGILHPRLARWSGKRNGNGNGIWKS